MIPDIVYIYGDGCSKWRSREMKYSLRSLEKFGKNYGEVYIVGDKPLYLNDKIIHIQKTDDLLHLKERRICEKILTACKTKEISDPFIFFNDDFFLVKEIDFATLDYYYFDNLESKAKRRPKNDAYKKALINTANILNERGLSITHFDIHYPMKYYKEKFIKVMEQYDWDKARAGYVIKSLYANTIRIAGKLRVDKKMPPSHSKNEIRKYISETDLFSTDDITRAIAETFESLYPDKSSYEK